jgi:hypothetical protein
MMVRRSLLAIAIAALPVDPGRSQVPTICDQPFDGNMTGLYGRIRGMPGAVAMPSQSPDFEVISIEPHGDLWNFTKATHPAHPSVACRRLVRQGDAWNVRTDIQCRAAKPQCDKLAADYRALDNQMRESIRRTYPSK